MKSVSMAQSKINDVLSGLFDQQRCPHAGSMHTARPVSLSIFIRTETLETPPVRGLIDHRERSKMIVNRVPFMSALRSMKFGSSCALGFFAFGFNARRAGDSAGAARAGRGRSSSLPAAGINCCSALDEETRQITPVWSSYVHEIRTFGRTQWPGRGS